MTIKVYPSLMPGEPLEVHAFAGGTLRNWLETKGIDYRAHETQPITVSMNGMLLPPNEWNTVLVGGADDIEIRLLPHGGVFKALGSIIGKVFNIAFGWLMPSVKANGRNDPGQGQSIETVDASANAAKLGAVVPELAGRFRRYPDYLTPPRRYFVNQREQWLEFLCCVGPGRYAINDADVKVGDTPFASLGGDGQFGIYGPGADLSGVQAHEHWYTVDEVGGTSSGTAGLELSSEFSANINPEASSYVFSNRTISIPEGAGHFPSGWGNGTFIDITLPLPYAVTTYQDTSENTISRFTGNFREVAPYVGMPVSAVGLNVSGSLRIWRMSLDGAGVGWVELASMGSEGETVIGSVSPGTYQIAFRRLGRNYRVNTVSDQSVTIDAVSGGAIEAGWAGFNSITSSAVTFVVDPNNIYGAWTSLFRGCPDAELTVATELDFFFTSGLAFIRDNGRLDNQTVSIEIQYRDARIGGAFMSTQRVYTQNTLDQIGFTERLNHDAMVPEVRVRRVGASSTSTQVQDKIQWYSLRTRLSTRTSYPSWTTMSVRLRGGGRLSAQSENQINIIATRILPTLQGDGSWSAEQPTRDISAFAKYVASTIGYSDDDLRMDELLRLHQIWVGRGDSLDHVFDETTVKDAMNTSFGAGMALLTLDEGRILPVRDGPRSVFEQSYSPQNMTSPLRRSFKSPHLDDYDGVEVEFVNEETWTKETVNCFLPGDQGMKVERLPLNGITSRARAWRIGMRYRRSMRYQNWEYSFSTELDALNSSYLSYVPLVDDISGVGQSAILERIEAVGGSALLHVSEPFVWVIGAQHVVAYRRPDGTLAGPFNALPGQDEFTVVASIPAPWPVVTLKQEPPHVYFGTVGDWTFPALIKEIRPDGLESVSVTATNYDARVYLDDNNAPS